MTPVRQRPPFVADERTQLVGWLDLQRAIVHVKCEGLPDEDAHRAVLPSSPLMTMAGIVSHLRWVEHLWFEVVFLGGPAVGPGLDDGPEDADMMVPGVPLARLLEEYGRQCAVSNEIIAAHPLDEPGRHPDFDDAAAGTASGCGVRRALRLRPLRPDDEMAFRAACDAMAADGFTFGLGLEPGMPWSSYLKNLDEQRAGVRLPAAQVPATFLVADIGGEIVGRSSIRHVLNDFLEREGGHIGYGVLPGHRRRGYATEILRQSLVIAGPTASAGC